MRLVGALVFALLGSGAAHANLLVNGDFNTGIPNAPGWTIMGNVFHVGMSPPQFPPFWFGAGTAAENGPGVIAFNADNAQVNGTISQTFGTVAGASYSFEFDFGGTTNTTQWLLAEILGSAPLPLFSQVVHDTNLPGTGDDALQPFIFAFLADGAHATVRFTDCGDALTDGIDECGPLFNNPTLNVDGVLDNVSVIGPSPAPEPATLGLLGIALAGLGLARRRRA